MNNAYFYEILNCGNLSAAAKKLGISQPALSKYLNKLENDLEFPLFDRTRTPFVLTEHGKLYLDYAKKADACEKEFREKINDINNLKIGSITVAGAVSSNICYLSDATADFLQKYPNIKVHVRDMRVHDIYDIAKNDEVDFFITPERHNNDGFVYIPFHTEKLYLCVPSSYEINEKLADIQVPITDILSGKARTTVYDPIDGSALNGLPFVLLEENTHIRKMSEKIFSQWALSPERYIVASQMMTTFAMTVRGSGISFITESILRFGNFRHFPTLYEIGGENGKRTLYICCKKDRYLSAACNCFIEMLKNSLNAEL